MDSHHYPVWATLKLGSAYIRNRSQQKQSRLSFNSPSRTDRQNYTKTLDSQFLKQEFQTEPIHLPEKCIECYTDGSCIDNRIPSWNTQAGWGFCFRTSSSTHKAEWIDQSGLFTYDPDTNIAEFKDYPSNNTAEIQAVVELLDYISYSPPFYPIIIYVDSQYTLDIIWDLSLPVTHFQLTHHLRNMYHYLQTK